MKNYKLLLYGFGTVGKGFIQQLLNNLFKEIECIGIIVKNPEKHSFQPFPIYAYDSKEEKDLFKQADIIVECTNDFEGGTQIIQKALEKNKVVVTASKKVLAENLHRWDSHLKENKNLLFEAAVAASIPIFRILNQHFFNEKIFKIEGILNGTSNYILTKIEKANLDYSAVLSESQKLGYAEVQPYLDVSGWDAAYKLMLLTYMAYGQIVTKENVLVEGIQNIRFSDIYIAKACNLRIKLIATVCLYEQSMIIQVVPQFVNKDSLFYAVNEANNGILINYENAETQFYYGKGAGSKATGSAIFNDVNFYLNYYKGYQPPIEKIHSLSIAHLEEFFYISLSNHYHYFIQRFKNSLKILHQDIDNQYIIVKSSLKNLLKIKHEEELPIQIIKIGNENDLHKIFTRKQYANFLL